MLKKILEMTVVALLVAGVVGVYFKVVGALPIAVTQTQKMTTFDVTGEGKIVVVVTHDPMLALMASRRIVMKNGGITRIISTSEDEQKVFKDIERVDGWLSGLRETIRQGEVVA